MKNYAINWSAIFIGLVVPSIILVLLFKLNLLSTNLFSGDGMGYWFDSQYYLDYRDIHTSRIYHSYLHPLWLALLRSLTSDNLIIIQAINICIFILSLYIFVAIFHKTLNTITLLLIASCPYTLYYADTLITETIYIPIHLIALSFLKYFMDTKKKRYFVLSILFCSLLFAIRSQFIFFALSFMISAFIIYSKFNIKNLLLGFLIAISFYYFTNSPNFLNKNYDSQNKQSTFIVFLSLWMGAQEYKDFPLSTKSTIDFNKYNSLSSSKDANQMRDVFINTIITEPISAIRSYIYRAYRIWVPMQHYNKSSAMGLGAKLSKIYGFIVFLFFLAGIFLAYKYEKNRNIFYIFLIPLAILWAQQIPFHTESRYISIIRVNQLYFAGFAIHFFFIKFLYNQIIKRRNNIA